MGGSQPFKIKGMADGNAWFFGDAPEYFFPTKLRFHCFLNGRGLTIQFPCFPTRNMKK